MAERRSGQPPKGGPEKGAEELQWWLDSLRSGKPPEDTNTLLPYMPSAHDPNYDPSAPHGQPVAGALLSPDHIKPADEEGADLGDMMERIWGTEGKGLANYTLPAGLLQRGRGGLINTPPQDLLAALQAHYSPQLKQTLGSPRPTLLPGLPGGSMINVPPSGLLPRGPMINVPRTTLPGARLTYGNNLAALARASLKA